MDTLLIRLLVGTTALVSYGALAVWMTVSINKPAQTDPIGVPLMMLGLCLMCTVPLAVVVSRWWVAKVNVHTP